MQESPLVEKDQFLRTDQKLILWLFLDWERLWLWLQSPSGLNLMETKYINVKQKTLSTLDSVYLLIYWESFALIDCAL